MKQTLPVQGMHCASCANIIERKLKKLEGIKKSQVNFATEKIEIEYDEHKQSIESLNEVIKPLGYTIQAKTSTNHAHDHGMETNTSKADKLKDLAIQKSQIDIVFPLTLAVFAAMLLSIAIEYKLQIPFSDIQLIPDALSMVIPTMHQFNGVFWILSTIIIFTVGKQFLQGVVTFARHRVANMDTLVGIGTLTAYIYSSIVFFVAPILNLDFLPNNTYFDVTIVVIGFVAYGKYLETKSKIQTGEAIERLIGLQAKTALLSIEDLSSQRSQTLKSLGYHIDTNEKAVEIKIEDVVISDVLVIKPGGKIPIDGIIVDGQSSIDESMITGEPIPVDKQKGDKAIGATINKQGSLKLKVERVGADTMLSQIIKMVENAQGSRAPIQKLADQISAVFVPTVLAISVITFVLWATVGSYFYGFEHAVTVAIISFVEILVIACPCALGLATPTAIIVGTGKGAENGILIKNAESLETLHKVDIIVTDKTGTITRGQPEVTDILPSSGIKEAEILQIIASLEEHSEHPLAHAIVQKAKEQNIKTQKVEKFEIIEGKGLKGSIEGQTYHAGNLKLLDDLKIKFDPKDIDTLSESGKTPVFLTNQNNVLAIIAIADKPKDNAKATIAQIHKLGIKVILLTGDNQKTAKFIASQVGIDEVIAEVLPDQKAEQIKKLKSQGKIVAMVGDGVNDAPALAEANIGIAMGTGTDVAIEAASLTLLHGDISKVLKAIQLSKATMRTIRQNLFWAFAYNTIGIPLAAGVFYPIWGILLNPAFAGFAMAMSSVSVVTNSLRLKMWK